VRLKQGKTNLSGESQGAKKPSGFLFLASPGGFFWDNQAWAKKNAWKHLNFCSCIKSGCLSKYPFGKQE
jgi:hypothetical protein